MPSKLELTTELVHHFSHAPTVDHAMRTWWMNVRQGGGLRLSRSGYLTFCEALEINSYEYELDPKVLTPGNLILLDRHLTCPYYLKLSRKDSCLILFGSREAMMAALYGDIKKFISSLTF
jgi:hypothetical protein